MMKKRSASFFVLMLMSLILAGNMSAKSYKEYAEEVRRDVWAMDFLKPENRKLPAKYKNESAVILACYESLEINKKTKFAFMENNYSKAMVISKHLIREAMYINDNASLKKFSEFDYQVIDKEKMGFSVRKNYKVVVGVRVIKPDGTIKEVNSDDYVDEEGQNSSDKHQKLAVPGLAIGDVVDVFVYSDKMLADRNFDPFVFTFSEEYPMLSYKVHCVTADNMSTQYHRLNGAPDFTLSQNEDGDNVLDAEVKDVPKRDVDLWYIPARQTPTTVLTVRRGFSDVLNPPSFHKGLKANVSSSVVLDDDFWYYKQCLFNSSFPTCYMNQVNKFRKELKKSDDSDVEKAKKLYSYMVYNLYLYCGNGYSDASFIVFFESQLDKLDIKYRSGITTPVLNESIENLSTINHTSWFAALTDGKTFFFSPEGYYAAGEIYGDFQGQKAVLGTGNTKEKEETTISLPVSEAKNNCQSADLKVSLDGLNMKIHRNMKNTCAMKSMEWNDIVHFEDITNKYRTYFGETDDFMKKFSKKEAAEVEEIFRKDKASADDNYKEEIKFYHGNDAKQLEKHELVNTGFDYNNPVFEYNVDYVMDGMVKKAGKNIVLSVGKLLGDLLQIEGNDRVRNVDIYRITASSYKWNIEITLPSGSVPSSEGLKMLNTNITNDCGMFTSSAKFTDGKLIISAEKSYNHQVEPVANWDKSLRIVDASNNFTNKQLVVKCK